jgi:hypothetical protein
MIKNLMELYPVSREEITGGNDRKISVLIIQMEVESDVEILIESIKYKFDNGILACFNIATMECYIYKYTLLDSVDKIKEDLGLALEYIYYTSTSKEIGNLLQTIDKRNAPNGEAFMKKLNLN